MRRLPYYMIQPAMTMVCFDVLICSGDLATRANCWLPFAVTSMTTETGTGLVESRFQRGSPITKTRTGKCLARLPRICRKSIFCMAGCEIHHGLMLGSPAQCWKSVLVV